ncbi:MAG: helix-turn-helix transcriptional regulator [Acidaminococcaceae bacterium]|nr:helix-turn-helix transcriptional regulator [Acidaminococcaceae bacterium]
MNNIRELMDRAGMQQKELAASCKVSGPTVSDWVNNKKNPSGRNLKHLEEIFGVSSGVILGYDPVPRAGRRIEPPPEEDDAWAIRERLRRDPEYRLLFSAAEKATPEHLRAAAAMLKALEGNNHE